MAIQIPNPGTGNGATGDNEFVLWSKVKDNFSNTTHAASRIVGTGVGNLTPAENLYKVAFGKGNLTSIPSGGDLDSALSVGRYSVTNLTVNLPTAGFWALDVFDNVSTTSSTAVSQMAYGRNGNQSVAYRQYTGTEWTPWAIFYTTANTTKEPTTGYLKAASPILHLFNDSLEKEHEAVEQDITVEKLGVGDYLIKGSTGLSEEGWNLSPPKDIHGNVLCMVEATESDGNINIKTYKRKFDFDIVAIVPDLDQPFDIPDGHSVDLRLNDLAQETQTEV